jgi:50S ribosome-binding GTPase
MAQEQEIDARAQGILKGLGDLQALLDEPITRHALDLSNNAKTAHQHDILNRTYRSLTQYLRLEGDLFYVGMLGHFSTGKSSTINSVLDTWGTADERPTNQNPTDTTITLITRPKNEPYLLGVIREGTVTIRSKPIDNPLLENVVLVDTPGTGDPEQLEEIARDFLPICDVILFFFSGASPLDSNDRPLLEELHRRLPFVPIHFIVTRADELRNDILAAVSDDNIDPTKRGSFFDDVLGRLNKLLKPKLYTAENFILIDNRHKYNISTVAQFIRSKCDPTNSRSRVSMHGHKLTYFSTMAKELRGFFETFLDNKLRELTKIVQTAEQNRVRYTENVRISNNNLTKTWTDQRLAVNSERERVLKLLENPEQLPSVVDGFELIRKRRQEISGEILEEAQRTAVHINEALKFKILSRLIDQIREYEFSNLERFESGAGGGVIEGISLTVPQFELSSSIPIVPSILISKWANFREAKVGSLREAAAKLRKAFEETSVLIQTSSPFAEYEKIVQAAQKSLSDDLTLFFGNAELYRAGVFSHTTKESIGALGLGKELDDLESEFSEADRAPFTADAIQSVFQNFPEVSNDARTRMAALDKKLRPLVMRSNDLKVPSPEGNYKQFDPLLDAERNSLAQEVSRELHDNVGLFLGTLEAKLSGIVLERRRAYEKEIIEARKHRRYLYGAAVALGVTLGVLSYVAYVYAVDIPQNNFHAVIWNIVAQLIWVPLAFFAAKWVDKFPKRSATIRHDSEAMLRRSLEKIAEEEINAHEFAAISAPTLTQRLSKAYQGLIDVDPDSWNIAAADRLNAFRELHSEFTKIHSEYVSLVESVADRVSGYFSDASKNLQLLNDVADKIKARAIEPSFKLLGDTRESLSRIRQKVHEVEFG